MASAVELLSSQRQAGPSARRKLYSLAGKGSTAFNNFEDTREVWDLKHTLRYLSYFSPQPDVATF